MTLETIRSRVATLCMSQPFGLLQAVTPFSFDLQPSGQADAVFRLETQGGATLGGFNLTEERTDLVFVWVARKHAGDTEATYQRLLADATALRAAVVRDGCVVSGEYHVPNDGAGLIVQREPGKEFAVLRLTIPVNYELSLAS